MPTITTITLTTLLSLLMGIFPFFTNPFKTFQCAIDPATYDQHCLVTFTSPSPTKTISVTIYLANGVKQTTSFQQTGFELTTGPTASKIVKISTGLFWSKTPTVISTEEFYKAVGVSK